MKKIQYNGSSKLLNGIISKINWLIDKTVTDVKVRANSQATYSSSVTVVDGERVAMLTIPVDTSDLTNNAGFITKAVNDLANYYLKEETYTQEEVNQLISHVTGVHFLVRQVLPTEDIDMNAIYLIPKTIGTTETDYYNEFVYIEEQAPKTSHWECIGTTEIDLSGYIKKSQTSGLVKNDGTIDTTQYISSFDSLDGVITGTPGAGKTLTALSENNGIVNATFGDIEITTSQISNFPIIPTVNDAKLTINQNSTLKGEFTANDSDNVTVNLTDENVKQTDITDTSWRCLTMASDSTKTETTAGVRKTVGLSMQVNKVGTASQTGQIVLAIGNSIATGNADNYRGYLDIYNNGKRSRIYSNTTDNRNMVIPNKAGTFALTSDIPTNTSDLTNDSNFVSDANYVHTDNNYTTTEKNKLSGIAEGAEVNVQSDWNATSGDAFIKNKPSIPAAQVNSDWNASSGVAQILNKPTILTLGTSGTTAYRGDRGNTAYTHATDSDRLTTATASGLYKVGSTAQGHISELVAVEKADITALGIPSSDTNTHRPIKLNDTPILGNNTTALNLKNGDNVSMSNSSGTVTINATDTDKRKGFYGTTDTAAATATKVVTLSNTDGWELKAGVIVGVYFSETNTAGSVKLNVNGSTAKSISYTGNTAYTGTNANITGRASHTTYYMFNGTYWVFFNCTYNYQNSTYTINNKTITLQQNGTDVDSFTLNQSTDQTINLTDNKVAQTDASSTGWRNLALVRNNKTSYTEDVKKSMGLTMQVQTIGVANTEGRVNLAIGNSKAKTAADNYTGYLYMYNGNGARDTIQTNSSQTGNITLTLPNATGTFALVSDISTAISTALTWQRGNSITTSSAVLCDALHEVHITFSSSLNVKAVFNSPISTLAGSDSNSAQYTLYFNNNSYITFRVWTASNKVYGKVTSYVINGSQEPFLSEEVYYR